MKVDVIFAGVGGQGVVTMARVLAATAMASGREVVQGELHGMSQRGGAVQAQLRIADRPIESPQVARGAADLVAALEPVEALRSLPWLAPGGRTCSAMRPVENVPDYPPIESVLAALRGVPGALLVDAHGLALAAGSARAENFAMAGAVAALLPVDESCLHDVVDRKTAKWAQRDRDAALGALSAGLELARSEGARPLGEEAAGQA